MFILVAFMSCYKVVTLNNLSSGDEIVRSVSFKDDVVPLFSKSCSVSGCHNTGGIKPDLSSDKAYNSIINGNYIDLSTPENSLIYQWLTGKKSPAMPAGSTNNPSNINQFVLAWIKQGGQNN